jgi:hypothetical protein
MRHRPHPSFGVTLLLWIACSGGSNPQPALDEVCLELAMRFCAQDRPCCEKAGFGFNPSRCQAFYLDGCGRDVAAVKAGKAAFDPPKLDDCVRQYQPFEDACLLDSAQRLRLARETAACAQIFRGLVPLGGTCSGSEECASSSPDREGLCEPNKNACADWADLVEGAICDGTAGYCTAGLTCDYGGTGRCVPDPERRPVVSETGCRGG